MKHPVNKAAEVNVLGAMMNDKGALFEAMAGIDEDFFYSDETRHIFNLIIEASSSGNAVKSSVLEKMTKEPREKALIRTADNSFKDYDSFKLDLEEVQNAYLNRQLYFITEKTRSAIENGKKAKETIDSISDALSGLYFDDQGTNIIDPHEDAIEGLTEFMEGLDNPDSTYGVRFSVERKGKMIGFPGLDEVFRGAQGGDLFLIAARTGEGKTALATNLARLFSLYQPYRGYYENTEMKIKELRSRLLAPLADVKVEEIMNSKLEGSTAEQDAKKSRISKVFDHYRKSGLHLSRIPVLSSNKAKALAKQVRNKYGNLDYLMVDYIGRMDLEDSKGMQEWQVMFKVMQDMKELAMELDVPVFMLGQRKQDGDIEGAKKIANECDGVLYFEPIGEHDEDAINSAYLSADKRRRVNYKITKRKIRRSSNTFPIFCEFDKDKQFINEVL